MSPAFVLAAGTYDGPVDTESGHPADLPAPYLAVEVEVTSRAGSGRVTAGLVSADGALGLRALVDPTSGEVSLELVTGGRSTTLGSTRHRLPSGGFTIGFALCERHVTVFVRSKPGDWTPVISEPVSTSTADLRDPQLLQRLDFAWGVRGGRRDLGSARGGLFGMTGLRDPHVVQNADGTPYERDGKIFLTWTCAGAGFFTQAHWGVFALDPKHPRAMRQVAQIYTRRDGVVLGDHAGQVVRDGDRWLVANSSWGDFDGAGVHVRHAVSDADLLSGVHALETDPVDLPTRLSSWDPSFTRVDGAWHVAYTESPSQKPFDFHPALARTSDANPFSGLTKVGADEAVHQTEGTILADDGDRWLLLASDGRSRHFPVYDLSMRRIGQLTAPYGTNIPHPQVIPRDDGSWLMVTFDGTDHFSRELGYGGHGDVILLESG